MECSPKEYGTKDPLEFYSVLGAIKLKRDMDRMYLANRYFRTLRPNWNLPLRTNSKDETTQGAAKAEIP
jgi:hypothetical protein